MKILLSWLKEYLPQADQTTLPGLFTRAGIEVDFSEVLKPLFTNVVAARVKKISKHSGSSHLACATVFDGKNEHVVVCGAANCHEGMITAFAPVGAIVSKKCIEPTQFGDTVSHGVLCSEHELGLSEFHEGIVELPQSVKEGTSLAEFFTDTVYEVSVTPNLGHCQSVMGIARELAAFMGANLDKRPDITDSIALKAASTSKISVTVQDSKLCPRYSALLLEGVKVAPSLSLVRIRLERSGIRCINNIVDATNYISHDIGQPLHAFDADRVQKGTLVVRASKESETLTMLDEQTHKLPEGTIVITDGQQILAAGGIMGGEGSAVVSTTTRVILESAHFNPSAIRKARTKLFLSTDSSKRFERGTDSNITVKALENAYAMLKQTCPQVQAEAFVDVATLSPQKKVSCRRSRASMLLGYEVSVNEAETCFSSLGLVSTFDGQDTFSVAVPSFRHDINEEVDLIEEIGRLMGLQRDMSTSRFSASKLPHHPLYLFEGEVRRRLLSFGLQEAITSDLISPAMAALLVNNTVTDDFLVKMVNPLSSEQSVLRPSLLPGLLEVVQRNFNQGSYDLRFFEVGHAHLKKGDGFVEPRIFSILLTGTKAPEHFSHDNNSWDFYDLKGMLVELFTVLGFKSISVKKSELATLHPGRQAKVFVEGVHVGIMGEIHPELLATFGILKPVLFAECDMQELMNLPRRTPKMQELAIFPSSQRDWTITLPKKISYDEIIERINEIKPSICESASLADIFEHEKLGLDKHNVTLHFVYRDREKTIAQETVDKAHQTLVLKVTHYLAEKYPG